jgi:hypothetical protein
MASIRDKEMFHQVSKSNEDESGGALNRSFNTLYENDILLFLFRKGIRDEVVTLP